jgi:hypothetical protein
MTQNLSKKDRYESWNHDIAEILLKLALNTNQSINQSIMNHGMNPPLKESDSEAF